MPSTEPTPPPSAWARFRRLPIWLQVVIWVFLWPVPTALLAASRPPADRRRYWALAAVVSLVWVGVAIAGQQDRPTAGEQQAGQVRGTTTSTGATNTSTSASGGETTTSTASPGDSGGSPT